MTEEHCRDCCCARSWNALGITKYTGQSIPEHIQALRERHDRLLGALKMCDEYYGEDSDVFYIARTAITEAEKLKAGE